MYGCSNDRRYPNLWVNFYFLARIHSDKICLCADQLIGSAALSRIDIESTVLLFAISFWIIFLQTNLIWDVLFRICLWKSINEDNPVEVDHGPKMTHDLCCLIHMRRSRFNFKQEKPLAFCTIWLFCCRVTVLASHLIKYYVITLCNDNLFVSQICYQAACTPGSNQVFQT